MPPQRPPQSPAEPARSARTTNASSRVFDLAWWGSALVPVLTGLFLGLGLLAGSRERAGLWWSFWGAATMLLLWAGVLVVSSRARGTRLTLDVAPRKQHYLQACAQASVLLYWGWFWPPVYDAAPLIAAQIVFAYSFDALLAWSRRGHYTLGFGPVPVVFSTNLFLWFKPDWFYLQFLMVALGFFAKDTIRWNKDGRRAHIFNPSSFTLAIFSLGLIFTGTTHLTWGQEIAITQFYPPHMYLMLFLVGLPGQFLFGVTTMTMSAVLSTYLIGLGYFAATGQYFFYDSYVPIAVFLGMHLLFTDPSTSPRTELGRIIFGVLYGSSSVALYHWLGMLGVPAFYDKLLQVPLLNLSIKAIDGAARSRLLRWMDPTAFGRALSQRQRHLAYITVWAATFAVLSAVQGVGDTHRGQWMPFWQRACDAGQSRACAYLAGLESLACNAGSGWACNERALAHATASPRRGREDALDPVDIADLFARGCAEGFSTACENRAVFLAGGTNLMSAPPELDDYPIVLRGTKAPLEGWAAEALQARACEQGWPGACARTAPVERTSRP